MVEGKNGLWILEPVKKGFRSVTYQRQLRGNYRGTKKPVRFQRQRETCKGEAEILSYRAARRAPRTTPRPPKAPGTGLRLFFGDGRFPNPL